MAVQTMKNKGEGKGNGIRVKVDPEESEGHSLVKSKHRVPNDGQQKTVLGGPQRR